MLEQLKKIFLEEPDDDGRTEADIRLAAAALLIEVARADHQQDSAEESTMATLLINTLGIDPETVDALMRSAQRKVEEATSLFEFTRLINEHYSIEQKRSLVQSMWQVAYADASLDKYEEHIIRRVAELIYLPHPDFIAAKLEARTQAEQYSG